jgi:DNA-binding XRE family transcriptional regulator
MCNMAETGYKPVPHDAAFRKALLAKPGVQKAFDELEEEYTALHAMLQARQAAGLTQAEVATRIGTTVSAVSRLEASLRSEKHSPSFAALRKKVADDVHQHMPFAFGQCAGTGQALPRSSQAEGSS